HSENALLLDDPHIDQAADPGIVTGAAEHISLRLFDDPFADGVLMDMGDTVKQTAWLLIVDTERAAAVLPQMEFFYPPQGFTIVLEMTHHPVPAEVHLHLYRLENDRSSIFFEIPFEIGRRGGLPGPHDQVEMTGHKAPGIDDQPLGLDKVIERVGDSLLVSRPNEYVYFVHRIEGQKIGGIDRKDRFLLGKHFQLFW